MYKNCCLLTYYCLTPLHMGTGNSLSYVDLPIQRERHTSFPMMAGSGIKGVFRSFAERKWNDNEKVNKIFGPEDGSKHSSCVAFTDAKILLYPVRSVKNIFAWVTCPFVLRRFKEEIKFVRKDINFEIPSIEDTQIIVCNNSKLKIDNNNVGLEEFVFEINNNNIESISNSIKELLPQTETKDSIAERFAIVSDNVFTDLVNYAVEVRTRIKIDQTTGTASSGALFSVEMVPSEAIFYSFIFANYAQNATDSPINEIKSLFNNTNNTEVTLQFGGDETIGVGFMKIKFTERDSQS